MPLDVLIAVWGLRILGALALVTLVFAGVWKLCERILDWMGLYTAFRLWWLDYAFWKVGRDTKGKPQPHRCWCGHRHAPEQPPKPAPKPPTNDRDDDGGDDGDP